MVLYWWHLKAPISFLLPQAEQHSSSRAACNGLSWVWLGAKMVMQSTEWSAVRLTAGQPMLCTEKQCATCSFVVPMARGKETAKNDSTTEQKFERRLRRAWETLLFSLNHSSTENQIFLKKKKRVQTRCSRSVQHSAPLFISISQDAVHLGARRVGGAPSTRGR